MKRVVSLATAALLAASLPAAAAQARRPDAETAKSNGTTSGTHAPTSRSGAKRHHKVAKHGGTTAQKNRRHARTNHGKRSANG